VLLLQQEFVERALPVLARRAAAKEASVRRHHDRAVTVRPQKEAGMSRKPLQHQRMGQANAVQTAAAYGRNGRLNGLKE